MNLLRSFAHLVVIVAMLPGIILPGPIAVCVCAAVSCDDCAGCCSVAPAPKSCCAAHGATRAKPAGDGGPRLVPRKACVGCVHLKPEKHQTTRPQSQAHELPDFAHATFVAAIPIAPVSITLAPRARPTSHAPPDELRSLPIVI